MVDPRTWRHRKDEAKELFGKPARLLVAAWALEHGEAFYLQEVQDALKVFGEAPSATRTALLTLEDLAMVSRFPDGRRVYFSVMGHPHWSIYLAMAKSFDLLDARTWQRRSDDLIITSGSEPVRFTADGDHPRSRPSR